MSNLEKNIDNFKKKLSERNILTEDDLSEIETHIIDKVDDLKQTGINEDDAFDKAIYDLGSIDEIAAEYSKVNLSAKAKLILICLGYFSINFMLSIISLITLSVSYFIKSIPSAYDYSYIPLITPLIKLYNYDYSSNAILITFLVNTVLILLLLYFMLKRKNNLLSFISNKILSIPSSKAAIKITVSLLIISLPFLSIMLYNLALHDLSYSMSFDITLKNINITIINIALILSLAIRYMKSKVPEDTSSYLILGYMIIMIASRLVPTIVLDISILAGQFNIVCISILFIAFFVITCYLIRRLINNHILEKKPSIIPAVLLAVFFIGSYFIYPHAAYLDYTLYSPCMIRFGDLSFMVEFFINIAAVAAIFSDHRLSLRRKEA